MSRPICLLTVALWLVAGCDGTTEDEQPDYCDGSFSASANGERFEANHCSGGPINVLGYLSASGSLTSSTSSDAYRVLHSVGLSIRPIPPVGTSGTYTTTGDCGGFVGGTVCASYTSESASGIENFRADEGSGTIQITTYTADRLVGSFEFEALAEDGSRVQITEGRFDIRLPE